MLGEWCVLSLASPVCDVLEAQHTRSKQDDGSKLNLSIFLGKEFSLMLYAELEGLLKDSSSILQRQWRSSSQLPSSLIN